MDEVASELVFVKMYLSVMDDLKIDIPDAEMAHVKCLRDFARVIEPYLPSDADNEARAIAIVEAAAREVKDGNLADNPLDLPFKDAFPPLRPSA